MSKFLKLHQKQKYLFRTHKTSYLMTVYPQKSDDSIEASAFTPFIFYITLHYVKVPSHFWLNIQSVFYGNSVTAVTTEFFFSVWAKALWCGRLQEICMKLIPLRNDIGNKYSRSWLSRNCENFKKIQSSNKYQVES